MGEMVHGILMITALIPS